MTTFLQKTPCLLARRDLLASTSFLPCRSRICAVLSFRSSLSASHRAPVSPLPARPPGYSPLFLRLGLRSFRSVLCWFALLRPPLLPHLDFGSCSSPLLRLLLLPPSPLPSSSPPALFSRGSPLPVLLSSSPSLCFPSPLLSSSPPLLAFFSLALLLFVGVVLGGRSFSPLFSRGGRKEKKAPRRGGVWRGAPGLKRFPR